MKKHSLVIFDLGDHSPAGRARVVEYLANRFEISPDIVGARLRDMPFVLKNWLGDEEVGEIRTALDEHHCVFDVVENLGNVSDLTPPPLKSHTPATGSKSEVSPLEASSPLDVTTGENAPHSAKVNEDKASTEAAKVEDASDSLMSFEITEPTASEVEVVAEQISVIEKSSGAIGDKKPEVRGSVAMPTGGLDLSFDEVESPTPPNPKTPAPELAKAPASPGASSSALSFDAPSIEVTDRPAASGSPVLSTSQPPTESATLDFNLNLSDEPTDIKPLVEEFQEIDAPQNDSLDLKPVLESELAPAPPQKLTQAPTTGLKGGQPATEQKRTSPPHPAAPAPAGLPPAEEELPDTPAEDVFTEEEEAQLTRAPVPLKEKTSRSSSRSFTLFHALGLFLILVAGVFYLMMPKASDEVPQLTLSEGSIDKLLKEQEQILNPVTGPARSISRWVGKVEEDSGTTTVNLSLDLNQVMLNDIKGYASLEIFGTGKEPPKLSPEEIVAKKPFPIWVTRFEGSLAKFTQQEEQSGALRKFEALGEARVYLRQLEKTSRIVSPIRVSGTLDLEAKRIEGKWELYYGGELPAEGTAQFAENTGASFKIYFFGPILAEPTAPEVTSSGSAASSSASKSSDQRADKKG